MNYVYIVFNLIEKHIMMEIWQQFPLPFLQYICISMDNAQPTTTTTTTTPTTTFCMMYIQIKLKKVVNKHGWFLDKVTGTYDRRREYHHIH